MTRRSEKALAKLRGTDKEDGDGKERSSGFYAQVYLQIRDMNPARSTTLKKAMRARRIENGNRPFTFADDILTPREIRRKEKTGEPYPADHTLRHAGGALQVAELLMLRFNSIDHVKTLRGKQHA